ncbi:MAG: iron-sulfur cluster-binding protein [Chloroflexi bacterium RBG_19FT_COMBO_47_9]|nr:MAG: iron-sulfur cluster-binding protein [Chloroflexi bacterium RBG_19FT_COMBO_47_9]
MGNAFHSRIRSALADANLQLALDANAEKRIKVRQTAFESLSNPEQLRARAHNMREDVIEHLDVYLETFIARARKNGVIVHRAADAYQAINIVMEIASQKEAKLIAKSKTMVSEEIRLNPALEEHGFQVVETDLGEYIVQLRGEAPSHIITPAVHLRRQDVGKLFEEKLGLPYTEDISVMTNAARSTLRQVFLDADIGISGVNFGVAETGTLCVVTNEGNGRMVTTIPRTHIALMGIERMVPTMDDLALMLSLLPRSATGQKLSVYTSLLTSPRRMDDPDGPQERHIILIDNGRFEVRRSELSEILYCIRCGACLNACPVFREIGGHAYVGRNGMGSTYPGPVGSVISPALFGQCEFGHLARASSLCGACKEACPVEIDLPKLLLRVRAGIGVQAPRALAKPNTPKLLKLGVGIFTLAATSPKRFAVTQWLAGLFGSAATLFSKGDPWIRLPAFSGWGYSKDFPLPASKPFHDRYNTQANPIADEEHKLPVHGDTSTKSSPKKYDEDLLAKFSDELEALGGKFYSCSTNEVWHKILEILQVHDVKEILSWDVGTLPDRLLENLTEAGIQVVFPTSENIRTISHIRAGITGAFGAIAESGSIVILGGAGQPLTASLLPEIHIALLQEKDVFWQLSQVLNMGEIEQVAAAVLISGPSRTADIEMTLTIGVHGPGELHIICLKDG